MRLRTTTLRAGLVATACAFAPGTTFAADTDEGSHALDPTHTFVHLEFVPAGISTTRVRFDRKAGVVHFDRAARSGRVEIAVEMSSLSSGNAAFDDLLRGKQVFDVAAHPQAVFVGERFLFSGDRVAEVVGTLTLRGQTHPLTLKAMRFNCYFNPLFRREVCGGDFEAVVRRSLWGLDHGLPALAPDEVRLVVQVEAIRREP